MKILDYDGFKQVITKIKALIDKKAETTDLETLKTTVDKKVDAVSGKGLSTNDFTNSRRDTVDELTMKNPPSSDFNSVSKQGIYNGSFSSNCPNGSGKYTLIVLPTNSSSSNKLNYMFQFAIKDNTDGTPSFRLRRGSSNWGKWYKYSTNDYTDSEKHKLSALPEKIIIPNPPLPIMDLKANIINDNKIQLTWINPIDNKYAGVKIMKKIGDTPTSISDGTQIYSGKGNNCYDTIDPYNINNYRGFTFNTDSEYNSDLSQSIEIPVQYDDLIGSPGSKKLLKGTMEQGWFGEVSASDFITGNELARVVGITAGSSQYSNEPWLKFAYMGKIEFVAKKPIRHSISWDSINAANAVFGDKTVKIGDHTYKVRLVKGKTEGKQSDIRESSGHINMWSEWNRLMLPIHENAPFRWQYKDNVAYPTENWDTNYTNADLITFNGSGNGSYTWCQEQGNTTGSALFRGNGGVSCSGSFSSSNNTKDCGWRPVLELVR
ncbi:MAG: hypothetical protein E7F47_01630 [Peptoniphilus harei]|nr:hypothetical protein [Peptoniphilus harei]